MNIFRPVDLFGVFLPGITITVALLLILTQLKIEGMWKIAALFPGAIAILLVIPIPNYHNVMVCIGEIISFYSNNRNYKWRGWCAIYESEREQAAKPKQTTSKENSKETR